MKMTFEQSKEILESAGYKLESLKSDLARYESRFSVGVGAASNSVIQWSRAKSGALEGGEKFYPKYVVLELIKEYEAEIAALKESQISKTESSDL